MWGWGQSTKWNKTHHIPWLAMGEETPSNSNIRSFLVLTIHPCCAVVFSCIFWFWTSFFVCAHCYNSRGHSPPKREGDWAGTNPQEATWWHCLQVHDLQISRLGWNLATDILQWFRIKWIYSTWILSGQTLFTKLKQDDFSVTPLLSHLFLVRARDVDVIHPNYI